jgi:purine-binding chemotaxis protein CheW
MSRNPGTDPLVVFALHEGRYGLSLSVVERIVRVVEVTPLPKAPDIVLGVVNVQGRVIPVINVRRRFRLPEREIALTNQMVIARSARRPIALVVDSVTGVLETSEQQSVAAGDVLPELQYVEGVVKLDDGLILIHNLDKFLSLDEEVLLDQAIEIHS